MRQSADRLQPHLFHRARSETRRCRCSPETSLDLQIPARVTHCLPPKNYSPTSGAQRSPQPRGSTFLKLHYYRCAPHLSASFVSRILRLTCDRVWRPTEESRDGDSRMLAAACDRLGRVPASGPCWPDVSPALPPDPRRAETARAILPDPAPKGRRQFAPAPAPAKVRHDNCARRWPAIATPTKRLSGAVAVP